MKKVLCFVMCFCLMLSTSFFGFIGANAQEMTDIEPTQLGTSDTYYSYSAQTKTLTVSGSGAMPNLKNNADYQPWYDFRSDGSIQNIVVEYGVTSIGNYAFYNVTASSITLPESIKTIGSYSFAYTAADTLELPFGLTSVGSYAFDGCTSLTNLSLPDTLKTIGSYAFRLCTQLESVAIPYSVTSLGSYAFSRCSKLSSLTFDNMTVEIKIGSNAFSDCPLLKSAAFPRFATLSSKAFGYASGALVSGVTMQVYESSNADIYAMNNSISTTYYDSCALKCGVKNSVSFDENNLSEVYTFTFTPDFSAAYNFYSIGEVDLMAELFDGAAKLAENNDLAENDDNFCISYDLTQGKTYTLKVHTMMSQGVGEVVVYPDEITSFSIGGAITFNARDGFRSGSTPYFPIIDSTLEELVINVVFTNGYTDKVRYVNGFFNNRTMSFNDIQGASPFTCGSNLDYIRIGDDSEPFEVVVNHSYNEEIVPYTAYDDGYTIFTCMLCGDSYIGDFVPTPAITVTGRCVLMTDTDGAYNENIPIKNISFVYDSREYRVNENGEFTFNTLESCDITLLNPYGADKIISITNADEDIDLGNIAICAYDFNRDSHINGRDLAVFKTQLEDELGKNYFVNAINFM